MPRPLPHPVPDRARRAAAIACLLAASGALAGNGRVEPRWSAGAVVAEEASAPAPGDLVVVHLESHRRDSSERELRLLRPLGGGYYLARAGRDVGDLGAGRAGVELTKLPSMVRLHPAILSSSGPRSAPIVATVLCAPDVDSAGEGREIARRVGAEVLGGSPIANALTLRLTVDGATALAMTEDVVWVEPASPALTEANDTMRLMSQADIAQSAPYGLSGAGVRAMVLDSGTADSAHPDLTGRVTVRDTSGTRQHATHVTGTLGGTGAASVGQYRGVAPGVVVDSYGIEIGTHTNDPGGSPLYLYTDPGDLEADYYEAVMVLGADLANNSLSTNISLNGIDCELEGDYAVMSMVLDGIVGGSLGRAVPIVWAGGNERGGAARCGSTYYTTPPPATAKNVIAVGAVTSDTDEVAIFSSWGPTDDGRLRPDLVAPGYQIGGDGGTTSTNQIVFGLYYTTFGTSMATPVVSGAIALLLEDFRAQFPGLPDPIPSFYKAILLHTAEDIGATGPDYRSGYGSLRIADAVDQLRSGQFVEESVSDGGVYRAFVDVPPGAAEVRVTMAWDDAPGSPIVAPALVNDLDLRLYSPTNVEHFPWTLDPKSPASPALRIGPDRTNNVEQALVDSPTPGRWRIEVRGHSVPVGPQRFSLCASPALSAVAIELVGGAPESVVPGEATVIEARVRTVGDALASPPTLRHRTHAGTYLSTAMTDLGGGVWSAALPASPCLGAPEFFIDAEGASVGAVSEPAGAPVVVHAPTVRETVVYFQDDFETNQGWTIGEPDDTASAGVWNRVDPRGSRAQPEYDRSPEGDRCFATGQNPANSNPNNGDVDDGRTTLTSPVISIAGAADAHAAYWRWFSNITGSNPATDVFRVEISADGGPWVEVENVGPTGPDSVAGWRRHEFRIADFVAPAGSIRLRFIAADEGGASTVEAAIDDVLVFEELCASTFCPGDADGDGQVTFADLNIVLGQFNSAGPGLAGDLNGDGQVNFADLNLVLSGFNTPCFVP